jgi:hypothetical protein
MVKQDGFIDLNICKSIIYIFYTIFNALFFAFMTLKSQIEFENA